MSKVTLLMFSFFLAFMKAESLQYTSYNISERQVWSNCINDSCKCGATLGKSVECVQGNLLIQPCYCLYCDESNITYAGYCFYTCFYPQYNNHDLYYSIRQYSIQQRSQFNNDMCANISLNRTGKFCGKCNSGSGFPVYSYDMNCIECKGKSFKIWCKYFAIAFGPLTVFYIVMVTFRVSMPTSRLNGLLFVIQCFTSPIQLRVYHLWTQTIPLKHENPFLTTFLKTFFSIIGWSNLDFFRELYPTFCLDPNYNILQVMSLDMIVALYPFLLILCTYVLICLHDKNCCFVVYVWKQINRLLNPILQKSVRVSLVETFATFILFSSVKIMGLSYDLLNYTIIYKENGLKDGLYVFYDPSISYFGKKHLPYALIAVVSAFLFGFLPFLLLLLYPLRAFHRVLNYCNIRSQALHVFMDAFQGSYKIEPYDVRHFAAWYLFLRLLFLLFSGYFTSILSYLAASLVMLLGALSVAIVRPYKHSWYNVQDIILLWNAAVIYLLAGADIAASLMDYNHLHIIQATVAFFTLFVVLSTLISLFWLPMTKLVCKIYSAYQQKLKRERLALL